MNSYCCRRRGVALLYASVFIFAIFGVTSLAVDWGRVQTAKTELQDAADAAARYAAAGLSDGTYVAKAQAAAAQNSVDGSALTLLASDIETGTWNTATHAFVLNGTPRDTVRVNALRGTARGNAVPLLFGRIVGAYSTDVTAHSVARQTSLAAVGINSLSLTGTASVRRLATEGGGVTTSSNGAYAMGGSTAIYGDALYGSTAPSGTVTGKTAPLDSSFTYATPTVDPAAYVISGNFTLNYNQAVTGPYAIYGNLYVTSGGVLTLYSDTTIYVSGTCTFDSNAQVVTNGYHLNLYSIGTGAFVFSSSNPTSVMVYAPTNAVTFSGPGAITGSVVGKTLSLNCAFYYTATLPLPIKPNGGGDAMAAGGVMTVK